MGNERGGDWNKKAAGREGKKALPAPLLHERQEALEKRNTGECCFKRNATVL